MKPVLGKISSLLLGTTLVTSALAATDGELAKVMKDRGLSEIDVVRAAKTYNPTGVKDKYVVFSSVDKVDKCLFMAFHL